MKSGYCTIMWNGRDRGASEMNHHQPHQRLVFMQRRWCCVYGEIGRESCIMSSFRKKQTINSNKYCCQLDQLKVALDEKHPELVNRKCIIFHQDNTRPHVSFMTRQKLRQLRWEFWFIHCVHQTLHLRISIDFSLYKFLLMEKISIPWKTVKGTWKSSLLKKIKSLGRWNYEVAWKMSEGSRTKGWIRWSIKFLVKMKKCVFFLLKKPNALFGPPYSMMVARCWGGGNLKLVFNGYRVFSFIRWKAFLR